MLCALALPAAWAQATTYTYTGDPYTVADPPYVLGGQLTGTLELAAPLPPFHPLTDISPAIVDFAFSDGVATRTLADSIVCGFEAATDGTGRITAWHIVLYQLIDVPGDPVQVIDSLGRVGVLDGRDVVGSGPGANNTCNPFVLSPTASSISGGTWTSDHPLPADPTVYTYTGDPYTYADPPYVVGGHLAGTLELAAPLPPFLPLTDISPAIVDFAFFDGVATRTLADSFLCKLELATDGAGRITRWEIQLRQFPLVNPGDPFHSIESHGWVGAFELTDFVGSGPGPVNGCDPMVLSPNAGNVSQGSWSSDHVLPPSDPTTYTYTGDPYTYADPPYALGGQLTGTLELAAPLPPFLPFTDISPAVVDLAFSDGVAARTLADSLLCKLKVATDGAGRITRWEIRLRPFPLVNPGDPLHSIESNGWVGPFELSDSVGYGPGPANGCDPMLLSPSAGNASQGTWTSDHVLPGDPTLYTYTGDPYTYADPPYVLGGQLTGTLELAAPLPPFHPLTDISPAIVDFAFSDGVATRTLDDSILCSFQVATDGTGRITAWHLTLYQLVYNPLDPVQVMDSVGRVGSFDGRDIVGSGPGLNNTCNPIVLSPTARNGSGGTWFAISARSVLEVPALGPLGAGVLALAIAALGAALLARRRRG